MSREVKTILSCGCIPFRLSAQGELEVLLILREKGFWEFPKGKKDEGESDKQTAIRELKEETGLVGEIVSDESIVIEYTFLEKGVMSNKKVHLFLCKISSSTPVNIDSMEVIEYAWLPFPEAKERLTYEEMKYAGSEAQKRLKTMFEESTRMY